ncbi:hypothetical protein [Butyrivibrio fibrisolvens]|uniref:hypothetical protein n=1 Tax=Butyrivibrio fibrisolvens TaxID=831 RepID=UPI0004823D02|nr:hypothetical protein [Butyrivibrio fibrisolvens]
MKKKSVKIAIILAVIVICVAFFVKGKREIATVYYPSDNDYYIKAYQIGYMYTTHYHCVCILYGPNGEISRAYFEAFSTDRHKPRYMREDQNLYIEWHDDYVSVRYADHETKGTIRDFYLDGRITSTPCLWDVDW